ncbi:hypothetical protein NFI96_012657, partial [Prochilodus magdalenae]
PSTNVFKTANLPVGRHAICPNEQPCSPHQYYTLEGIVIKMSTTQLKTTTGEPVPVLDLSLQCQDQKMDVTLWREAAVVQIALWDPASISHSRQKPKGSFQFNSTVYTVVKVIHYLLII